MAPSASRGSCLAKPWLSTSGARRLTFICASQEARSALYHLSFWNTEAELTSALSGPRSEEHTSELQSRFGISYAVFCLKKKKKTNEVWQRRFSQKIRKIQYADRLA